MMEIIMPFFYSDGITIHITVYINIPGNPPGNSNIINAKRNQNVLIPKNSDNPPAIPAITRLLLDRRRGRPCASDIIRTFLSIIHNLPINTKLFNYGCEGKKS